ncbi:MAG: PSD1 and planctomycete cytochrome C domain-containing protein [Bryobacterales bacterium]|nr:PSD1 and planctomycete cytochrome C domain-containing protein [Bryobacterales bacterium]
MGKQWLLAAGALVALLAPGLPAQAAKDFQSDIAPILAKNCVACHAGATAQGKLAVDSLEAIALGGASGAALVPGNSAESSLYQRLISEDRTLRMPLGSKALPPESIAAIKEWIDRLDALPGASTIAKAAKPGATSEIDFHRDIEPIFKANCYGCHAGAKPQSQLRLDAGAAALKGGLGGKVILPGDAKGSRLMHRVQGQGGERRMPLQATPLSDAQIATLARWIDAGAHWPGSNSIDAGAEISTHWSYVKPKRVATPTVRNAAWVRNGIDAFVLARLEKEGLQPSNRASKESLIRRLSLDLIGLPPSPAEVDTFLADESATAYETLVDRLLASPHYGERWARPWLDWARYADSHGFEKDMPRVMWKYRDWVIEALNANMPFDRFTVEQIAGDMLPNPTESQLIATGFNRNTMFNEEGGVDAAEAHHEVLVDRVNTTATVWLGSTVGCAQCHNHKFDPFTQKEYYQFYAFFANSEFNEKNYGDTSVKWMERSLDLPTGSQAQRRTELQARIDALELELKSETPALAEARRAWEKAQRDAESAWAPVRFTNLESTSGTTLHMAADASILASGNNPPNDTYLLEGKLAAPANIAALMIEALPDASLPRGGPGRDLYGNFILTDITVEVNATGRSGDWRTVEWSYAKPDDGRIGKVFEKPKPNEPEATASAETPIAPLPVAPGARAKERGEEHLWVVDASREVERLPRRLVVPFNQAVALTANAGVRITMLHASPFGKQGVGRFRVALSSDANPELLTELPARRRPILRVEESARDAAQAKQILESFAAATPLLAESRAALKARQKELRDLGIVSAMVMQDKAGYERPSAPLRIRGSFLSPGETVFADVPKALHPLPAEVMPNRLGLAKWLVSAENPLTARVMVNRFWETCFGIGLVETSEDFGTQGALPSHPELLDWLAVEFVESGWDLKRLFKLIAMSNSYQQDSSVTPALAERDPYNRLLARGPRFRMEAEMIRDVTLAGSGLLSAKVGGPSVYPYQPEGIWDVPYSNAKWEESVAEDRFRRGLYTFIRRSSPYPSMVTFDAPSREFCTIRRTRTNTPLQALNGLNDPVFFEAARALAQRVLAEGGDTTASRSSYAFRLLTARPAPPGQVKAMVEWFEQERARLRKDTKAAIAISGETAKPGSESIELAAWTLMANVLLNMDETVTKQ